MEANPVHGDKANQRDEDNERGVQPVDMLVPVTPSDGLVSDVHLLEVGWSSGAKRLVVGCAIGESLSLGRLGWHGGRGRHIGRRYRIVDALCCGLHKTVVCGVGSSEGRSGMYRPRRTLISKATMKGRGGKSSGGAGGGLLSLKNEE